MKTEQLIRQNQAELTDFHQQIRFNEWPCRPGSVWRHKKGTNYTVLAIAELIDGSLAVAYQETAFSLLEAKVWLRPASMWHEVVGEEPRFAYVGELLLPALPPQFLAIHTESLNIFELYREADGIWFAKLTGNKWEKTA